MKPTTPTTSEPAEDKAECDALKEIRRRAKIGRAKQHEEKLNGR